VKRETDRGRAAHNAVMLLFEALQDLRYLMAHGDLSLPLPFVEE